MNAASYDAIVIGTGQSGPYVTSRLAAAGMKVAVIERKVFGGTCVNTGCIPTKTMVASAFAARVAARSAEYGVETGPVRVDMKRVKARKDEVSKQSRVGLEDWLGHMENCTVHRGHARFESTHEVSVGAGVYVGGAPLQDVGTATTVQLKEGRRRVQDGPFAETKEQLGGYYELDCKDLDEAIKWAARIPGAATGAVEVRPIMEFE